MCNPIRGCGARLGMSSGYRDGSPNGVQRNAEMNIGVNRHTSDTRIGLMDSTVPVEAMIGV